MRIQLAMTMVTMERMVMLTVLLVVLAVAVAVAVVVLMARIKMVVVVAVVVVLRKAGRKGNLVFEEVQGIEGDALRLHAAIEIGYVYLL